MLVNKIQVMAANVMEMRRCAKEGACAPVDEDDSVEGAPPAPQCTEDTQSSSNESDFGALGPSDSDDDHCWGEGDLWFGDPDWVLAFQKIAHRE